MALLESAVLKPNTASFFKAPTGTAKPADLKTPGVEWENLGHTTFENILTTSSEGGETSTLRSLQTQQLRVSTTPRTESFQINLLQFDEDSLQLYYGANAVIDGEEIEVPSDPQPTECAWLAVLYDGEKVAGYYAPKASIFRAEDIAISDTESLAQLPLQVTPLTVEGAKSAYSFIKPHVPAGV